MTIPTYLQQNSEEIYTVLQLIDSDSLSMLHLFQRLVFRLSPLSSRFVDQLQDFGPSAVPSELWAQDLFLILSRATYFECPWMSRLDPTQRLAGWQLVNSSIFWFRQGILAFVTFQILFKTRIALWFTAIETWNHMCHSISRGKSYQLVILPISIVWLSVYWGDNCLLAAMFSGSLRVFSLPSHNEQAPLSGKVETLD